jgi:NADH-quinone oxidoreductase subunit G
MAANPQEDLVNVEVDGVPVKARKGAMIIHVTDAQQAYVPRFCYHDKLPVAANCRMCLVEVERAPKPLPACATPVAEGMKIFTKSPNAIAAQKATMEFLLINHPLDCPICDQGGECELQDLAMGFGRDISRFSERKRVVKDKNLGPLVSTDMTRCIHCTRCVRFGQDIAGIQELGTTGRGESTEIGTYIERSVDHELSGNIIDLCPVGALNSKPFRYRARSWEMTQVPLLAPHDGVGSNLYGHMLRGRLMRVVPRPNEAINETWISDRDRFSYEGIYSEDRLTVPMLREGTEWREASWEEALEAAAKGLKAAAPSLGVLVSPSATLEELYLAARIGRGLGSGNVDHRLRMLDFRDPAGDPGAPSLGLSLEQIEAVSGLLVVGSNLRSEAPILAHRVRKAVVRAGARVGLLNPGSFEFRFPIAGELVSPPARMVEDLLGVLAAAAGAEGVSVSRPIAELAQKVTVTEAHRALAMALRNGERRTIWLGALATRHPAWADLRAIATELALVVRATLGVLAEGGNAAGAWIAGAVPHRAAAGSRPSVAGLDVRAMLETPQKGYLLFGAIEPSCDMAQPALAAGALGAAQCVVAVTPYVTDEIRRFAHVLLPMGSFAETSGTYVNLAGVWQSQAGVARPVGQSRPGWKIARVLGNLLALEGFDYQSSEQVRDELKASADVAPALSPAHHHVPGALVSVPGGVLVDVPMYRVDAVLRRATSLQGTAIALRPVASW